MTASQALKHRWIQTQVEGADEIERRISVARNSGRKETFRKYLAMKKLKKAALSEIANHLTQEEVGTLGEIFHSIDTDNNGVMSLQELDEAIAHGELQQCSGCLSVQAVCEEQFSSRVDVLLIVLLAHHINRQLFSIAKGCSRRLERRTKAVGRGYHELEGLFGRDDGQEPCVEGRQDSAGI